MKTEDLKKTIIEDIKMFIPEEVEINDDDNLLSIGLDSLSIMRFISKWRKNGYRATFAELVENPFLNDWVLIFEKKSPLDEKTADVIKFKGGSFPLSDVQYAYYIGRGPDQIMGGVGCHAYLEFDGYNINPEKLSNAWRNLINFHPMLKASFQEGKQKYLSKTGIPDLIINNLGNEKSDIIQDLLDGIRERISHRVLPVQEGKTAGLELTLLPNNKTRIHFDLDLLVADVQSLQILLRDLCLFYTDGMKVSNASKWDFEEYIGSESVRKEKCIEEDKKYWNEKFFSPPDTIGLPIKVSPEKIEKPFFRRRNFILENRKWDNIRKKALKEGCTPAMVLLTAYGEIVNRWSSNDRFLMNVPVFDRQTEYEGIDDVVADFTNLLLFEMDFPDKAFKEQLKIVQKNFHKDLSHSSYSGIKVHRDISKLRGDNSNIAPVVFSCNLGAPLTDSVFKKNLGVMSYMISQTPQVWLDFQIYQEDEGILLCWDSVDELFPDGMMDSMFSEFRLLMEWLASENNSWGSNVHKAFKKKEFRETAPESFKPLHLGFFDSAERSPNKIAVFDSSDGKEYSYEQISFEALKIAAQLKKNGVKKGDYVAVSLPRGKDQIVAVLGILANGCCYVPVSNDQPYSRREVIHKKAGIRSVVTDRRTGEQVVWPDNTRIIYVEEKDKHKPAVLENVEASDSAYIIFTSGSTGEPKGVEISHASASNTIDEVNSINSISYKDTAICVSSLEFDLSVYDIFGILGKGGSIVIIPDEARRDASFWFNLLNTYNITVWNSVPVLLEMVLIVFESKKENCPGLKKIMLSGDWIGTDLPERIFKVFPGCRITAMGGATEASIWSNYYDVQLPLQPDWSSIPYGKPLKNQFYRIVDRNLKDCPVWVTGELLIGGTGLAKCYKGDSELTKKSFIHIDGMRWYKTGDLGRMRPCGNIEFIGRKDYQVKVRGHRIEPGEIENVINRYDGIKSSVVVKTISSNLAAAVLKSDNIEPDEKTLKEYLRKRLPEFMVPVHFSFYSKFPLNINGKIDRKKLASDLNSFAVAGSENEILSDLEFKILEVWKEVLGLKDISKKENFFFCGGDSLKATMIIETLIKKEIVPEKTSLGMLFNSPTIAEFALTLEKEDNKEQRMEQLETGVL